MSDRAALEAARRAHVAGSEQFESEAQALLGSLRRLVDSHLSIQSELDEAQRLIALSTPGHSGAVVSSSSAASSTTTRRSSGHRTSDPHMLASSSGLASLSSGGNTLDATELRQQRSSSARRSVPNAARRRLDDDDGDDEENSSDSSEASTQRRRRPSFDETTDNKRSVNSIAQSLQGLELRAPGTPSMGQKKKKGSGRSGQPPSPIPAALGSLRRGESTVISKRNRTGTGPIVKSEKKQRSSMFGKRAYQSSFDVTSGLTDEQRRKIAEKAAKNIRKKGSKRGKRSEVTSAPSISDNEAMEHWLPKYTKYFEWIKEYPKHDNFPPLVKALEGFQLELGREVDDKPLEELVPSDVESIEVELEDTESTIAYYHDQLSTVDHSNFLCHDANNENIVLVSVEDVPKGQERKLVRGLFRTVDYDERSLVPASKSNVEKVLKQAFPLIQKHKVHKIKHPDIQEMLLDYEDTILRYRHINTYKFGVLYVGGGQTDENAIFRNLEEDLSPDFVEFMDFIGDRIELQGWTKFRGGLDIKTNTTGTHSYYREFEGLEIMYHVAPLLPFDPNDEQALERKRHLGNDVVVIVFKEGDSPWDPSLIRSHFVHVHCVVERYRGSDLPDDETFYRIAFSSKGDMHPYGPYLPFPSVFKKTNQFRRLLLTKLINAERAALHVPAFQKRLAHTRAAQLDSVRTKLEK